MKLWQCKQSAFEEDTREVWLHTCKVASSTGRVAMLLGGTIHTKQV